MKAYRVWDINDEWQEIAFAPHHNTAKRVVAEELDSVWPRDLRAERLPDMDAHQNPFLGAYMETDKRIQRLSGIYPCERCGNQNGDGNLCCAKCEETK